MGGTGVKGVTGIEELLSSPSSDIHWDLSDCTVASYRAGESQVPHMDTCDLTMLVSLAGCGGATTFVNLDTKIPPRTGRVSLFFSTTLLAKRFGVSLGGPGASRTRCPCITAHPGSRVGSSLCSCFSVLLAWDRDNVFLPGEMYFEGVHSCPEVECSKSSWLLRARISCEKLQRR